MNVGTWNNHTFEVSNRRIRGFTGLTVKGGSETEYKTTSSQKYVSRKNSNPLEVSMTAILNRSTGCDVRKEAIALLRDSYNGAKGYFYLGGIKLIPFELMLTDANITETQIAPNGVMTSCKVQLTFKQSAKYTADNTSSSSSSSSSTSSNKTSSSKKTSTKKTSTTTKKKTTSSSSSKNSIKNTSSKDKATASTIIGGAIGAITGALLSSKSTASKVSSAKKAVSSASKTTAAAKKASFSLSKSTSKSAAKAKANNKITSSAKKKVTIKKK